MHEKQSFSNRLLKKDFHQTRRDTEKKCLLALNVQSHGWVQTVEDACPALFGLVTFPPTPVPAVPVVPKNCCQAFSFHY